MIRSITTANENRTTFVRLIQRTLYFYQRLCGTTETSLLHISLHFAAWNLVAWQRTWFDRPFS
jgi:hypothetical protein